MTRQIEDPFFVLSGIVVADLRGMQPTLTARKATQCLEETQTLTELST